MIPIELYSPFAEAINSLISQFYLEKVPQPEEELLLIYKYLLATHSLKKVNTANSKTKGQRLTHRMHVLADIIKDNVNEGEVKDKQRYIEEGGTNRYLAFLSLRSKKNKSYKAPEVFEIEGALSLLNHQSKAFSFGRDLLKEAKDKK